MHSFSPDKLNPVSFFYEIERDGVTVQLKMFPFTMQDLAEWSSHLHSLRLQQLKDNIQLVPEDRRASAMLNASSGNVSDAFSSMTDTVEGRNFVMDASFKRANETPIGVSQFLDFDENTELWREYAGRGGVIYPLSEEEGRRWKKKFQKPKES